MGIFESLQSLLGGPQQPQRREYQEFVRRYDEGPPWAGISDQEAASRYQQVAAQLPPEAYREAAEEAFARLSPQERLQLGRYLQQQARQRGAAVPDLDRDGIDDRLQDPGYLARATGQLQQRQPDLLGQLLGSALGGGGRQPAGGPGAGAGGLGEVLSNPLAKAALAGIAAAALKRAMGGR
jgi:hypothetical protein